MLVCAQSVQEAFPDHDKQRNELQQSVEKLKSEPSSHEDRYLDDVDKEIKEMEGTWAGLSKEVDDKINSLEKDQQQVPVNLIEDPV